MYRKDDRSQDIQGRQAFDHPVLSTLEDYWRSLRDADTIPARTSLDPAQIEQILPYTFILQRVAYGTARFRVAGQRIQDLLRLDPRGMPFTTLFREDVQDDVRMLAEGAFTDPAIVGLPLYAPAQLIRPCAEATMLLLPLNDRTGETTRLLGALVCDGNPSTKPRRFEIKDGVRHRYERLNIGEAAQKGTQVIARSEQKRPDVMKRPALQLVINNG